MRQLSPHRRLPDTPGYAMAGLLVMLGVMGILSTMLLPVWSQTATREREAELIFRGEQYARAVELYQRRYVGANPPDFETLVEQRFLRKMYADPMTEDGEFQVIYFSQVAEMQRGSAAEEPDESVSEATGGGRAATPIRFGDGQEGGVVGVVSRSDKESLRVYNDREKYNEWAFVYAPVATEAGGVGGGVQPSQRGPGGGGRDADDAPFSFGRRGDGARGGNRSGRQGGAGNRGSVEGQPRQPRESQPQ